MGKSRRKAENAALRDGVQKYIQEEAYNTQLVGATSSHFVDCCKFKLLLLGLRNKSTLFYQQKLAAEIRVHAHAVCKWNHNIL